MGKNKVAEELPEGFVLDEDPPDGFVLDSPEASSQRPEARTNPNPEVRLGSRGDVMPSFSQVAEDIAAPLTLPGKALHAAAGGIAEMGGRAGLPAPLSAALAAPVEGVATALPQTPLEAGVGVAAMGIPFSKAVGPTTKLISGAAEKFTPTFKKALEAAAQLKVTPTIAEITGSKAWGGLEALLEKLPFSAGKIHALKTANTNRLLEARNALLERFGAPKGNDILGAETKDALGETLQAGATARDMALRTERGKALSAFGPSSTAIEAGTVAKDLAAKASQKAREEARELYLGVGQEIPASRNLWPADNLRATARKILKQKGSAPSTLDGETSAMLTQIADSPQGLSWEKLHDLQSTYGKAARDNSYAVKAGAPGAAGFGTMKGEIFNSLKDAARSDMEAFSKAIGSKAKEKHEFATAFYKKYKDTYANETIRRMLRTEPQYVYDEIVRPGSVQDIKNLKAAVGDVGFSKIRRQFVEDVIGTSDAPIPSAAKIAERMSNYEPEALKEILNPQQFKQVNDFVRTMKLPRFLESEMETRLARIVKRDPIQVAAAITSGDTEIARATKKIVGDAGMMPFRRKLIEDAIGSVTEDVAGPQKLQKFMDSYSPEFLGTMFKPQELAEMQAIASVRGVLKTPSVLAGNPSGSGASAAAAAQAMLGFGPAGWTLLNPQTMLAVYITPPMIAKLYTSSVGRKLILEGITVSARDKRAASIAARIAAYSGAKYGRSVGKPVSELNKPQEQMPGKF